MPPPAFILHAPACLILHTQNFALILGTMLPHHALMARIRAPSVAAARPLAQSWRPLSRVASPSSAWPSRCLLDIFSTQKRRRDARPDLVSGGCGRQEAPAGFLGVECPYLALSGGRAILLSLIVGVALGPLLRGLDSWLWLRAWWLGLVRWSGLSYAYVFGMATALGLRPLGGRWARSIHFSLRRDGDSCSLFGRRCSSAPPGVT